MKFTRKYTLDQIVFILTVIILQYVIGGLKSLISDDTIQLQ